MKTLTNQIDKFCKLAQDVSDNFDIQSAFMSEYGMWDRDHPDATEQERDRISKLIQTEIAKPMYQKNKKLWKDYLIKIDKPNSQMVDLTNEEQDGWMKIHNDQLKINTQQQEFDDQDAEIEAAKHQEQQNKINQQKNLEGKTIFSQNDAQTVAKSLVAKIKAIPVAKGLITINFYSNCGVGFLTANPKIANLLRVKFAIELELALKQYLIFNKKYFSTQIVSTQITI